MAEHGVGGGPCAGGVPSALALRTLCRGATVQTRSCCLCPSQGRLLLPLRAPALAPTTSSSDSCQNGH